MYNRMKLRRLSCLIFLVVTRMLGQGAMTVSSVANHGSNLQITAGSVPFLNILQYLFLYLISLTIHSARFDSVCFGDLDIIKSCVLGFTHCSD